MHFDILMSFHVFADFAKKTHKKNWGKKVKENRQKIKVCFPLFLFGSPSFLFVVSPLSSDETTIQRPGKRACVVAMVLNSPQTDSVAANCEPKGSLQALKYP